MELASKQYYVHNSFINIYYYLYVALENWISNNIFREDPSRVFLSSPEFAFRRRFELTDMSKNYSEIDLTSLRFPFANYWPLNSGWQPDKRIAATTAALVYKGIDEGNTKIRAIPSIIEIPTIFYFDREDDARMAYDILYFKSFNEHYYTQKMPYAGNTIEIPVNVVIDNIEFNPEFKESNWLKENRIFTLKATFKMRSFVIHPPKQPKYQQSVDANGYLDGSELYDDGFERYEITEEVILKQKNKNEKLVSILRVPPPLGPNGTYQESNIKINQLEALPIGETSAKISWMEGQSDEKDKPIRAILSINGFNNSQELNLEKAYHIVDNLDPGSYYQFYITFYAKGGASKRLGVSYQQPKTTDQLVKTELPQNALVGISW